MKITVEIILLNLKKMRGIIEKKKLKLNKISRRANSLILLKNEKLNNY